MKPDWQNKSYAKNGAPAGPSTTHPKLKVGMSSLHSKIAVANHNTVQAKKPAVRKFADGGAVTTRSDDEIGDTNLRTGKVDPGSYERRMKAGEENMARLRSAADTIKSFFSGEGKSSSMPEGDYSMSESDRSKRQSTGRFGEDMNKPASAAQEAKMEKSEEPSYMKDVRETLSKPKAESTMTMPEEAKAPKASKSSMPSRLKAEPKSEVKMTGSPDMPASDVKPEAKPKAASKPQAPAGETYRTLDGKVARTTPKVEKPLDQQWGVHNVVPNLKDYAQSVGNYFKNFETPAERRARERKEGK